MREERSWSEVECEREVAKSGETGEEGELVESDKLSVYKIRERNKSAGIVRT